MPPPSVVTLRTRDGVRLVADHWPVDDRRLGCVIAHGFTGSGRSADVRRIARGLTEQGIGALTPDFRGHGRSGGVGTAGADEIHDLAAAVSWLRGAGYERVAVLGFSMGGSVVLRHAGLGGDADAVVSVSSPGTWFERGTPSMRLVHWMCEKRTGRFATRVVRRTRLSSAGWVVVPESPVEVVGAIAPTPLLVVHGDTDRYFPVRHVEALAGAAAGATVWIEPGMGHAELATTDDLVRRIARWLLGTADSAVCDHVRRD